MYEVLFEDDRIKVRKGTTEDALGLQRLLLDEEIMLYSGEMDSTYEYALSEIEWFNGLFEKGSGRWVIEDKKTGKYIGNIGIHDYNDQHKKGEMGYVLDKAYWQQGIMTICVQAVLDFAFVEKNYNRVEALVDVRNTACIALLNKSNFQKEGLLRDYEFEHGHYVDLEIHSILKREHVNQK